MKHFLFIILLSISVLNISAQEENSTADRKFIIKTNPFGALANMIPLSAELMLGKKFSISANGFIVNSSNGTGSTLFEQSGYSIGPEFRYYFTETESKGQINRVYVGGQYSYEDYRNRTLDRYDDPIDGWAHGIGGSLIVGNQWFFKNRFTVDIFLGPAYVEYIKNEDYETNLSKGGFLLGITGPKVTGTKVRFGFNIGIAL
ncbi:MAG: DUF3575 domain-containing protein [Bacteroidales bacterium]|nr:DUF3575 domain-containing protein [Bacteroidales bacterium]